MNRTSFLIDGFNLYHSVVDISRDFGIRAKWLDVFSLCRSYLSWVGNKATLEDIFYFSAYATHISEPYTILRHKTYIQCLKAKGIQDVIGRFKAKTISCPLFDPTSASCADCSGDILRHEEKETDVGIATKLLELFVLKRCDTIILMTGDTDITPTIKTAKTLFPDKSIRFIFPYGRDRYHYRSRNNPGQCHGRQPAQTADQGAGRSPLS